MSKLTIESIQKLQEEQNGTRTYVRCFDSLMDFGAKFKLVNSIDLGAFYNLRKFDRFHFTTNLFCGNFIKVAIVIYFSTLGTAFQNLSLCLLRYIYIGLF